MIRTFKERVDCINSLCGNFPRFTSFYDEKENRVNGGVCRLFLKNEMGEYTIPTPFFGFWSGDFAGDHSVWHPIEQVLNIEEYYELSIAGDCVHNFINYEQKNASFVDRNNEKYKFFEPEFAKDYEFYRGKSNPFCVGFDGKPIYPDILFSDFLYSTVFDFGREGWDRLFEIVGKYVFMSSPKWGIVEQNGKFGNRFWKEFIYNEDVVNDLIRIFKMGGVVLYEDKEFREKFEFMCDDCLFRDCPDRYLDELGKWLVSKGYQLEEVKKIYCCCNCYIDDYEGDGEMCFESGFGYDFAEIAFALLKRE